MKTITLGPLVLDATPTGAQIVDEGGSLVCRPTGSGIAECFGQVGYVSEYGAWCRYMKEHGFGVRVDYPRDFANEFDLVLVPVAEADLTGSKAAHKLTRPYRGREWYGSIYLGEERA